MVPMTGEPRGGSRDQTRPPGLCLRPHSLAGLLVLGTGREGGGYIGWQFKGLSERAEWELKYIPNALLAELCAPVGGSIDPEGPWLVGWGGPVE